MVLFVDSISGLSFRQTGLLIGAYRGLGKQPKNQIDRSRYTPEQLAALEAHVAAQPVSTSRTLDFTISSSFDDVFPQLDFCLTAYSLYDNHGQLPFAGPLADQPNQIIEIFNVLKAIQQEDAQKEQKKANGRK